MLPLFLLNFCVYIVSVKTSSMIVHLSLFHSNFVNFASYIFRYCHLSYTKLELLYISGGLTFFYHRVFLFFLSNDPYSLKHTLPVTSCSNVNTAHQLLLVSSSTLPFFVCHILKSYKTYLIHF